MPKAAVNTILQEMAALFTAVLRSSICPTAWCTGSITPTYKTGDITNPTNRKEGCEFGTIMIPSEKFKKTLNYLNHKASTRLLFSSLSIVLTLLSLY